MTAEPKDRRGPVLDVPMPFCDECQRPISVLCLLAEPTTPEAVAAIQAVLLAAHKRFHDEDRALNEAHHEATRRSFEIGPIA